MFFEDRRLGLEVSEANLAVLGRLGSILEASWRIQIASRLLPAAPRLLPDCSQAAPGCPRCCQAAPRGPGREETTPGCANMVRFIRGGNLKEGGS